MRRLVQHSPEYYRQKISLLIESYTEPNPYVSRRELAARKYRDGFVLYISCSGKSWIGHFQAIVSFEGDHTKIQFEKEPTEKRMEIRLMIVVACLLTGAAFYHHAVGMFILPLVVFSVFALVDRSIKQEFETIILRFLNNS